MADCGNLLTPENLTAAKTATDTITEFVESSDLTLLTAGGKTKKTIDGVIAQGEQDIATAIAAAGYAIVGDFADVVKVAINNPNEVYTSTSLLDFEGYAWRYIGVTYPYTPTGSDPNIAPEAGKWKAVAIGELQTIARALNGLDSDVIYDTDTVTPIPAYIYAASQQKTYAVPADAQGKFIDFVSGSTLHATVGGPYQLEIANEDMTKAIVVSANMFGAVSTTTPGFSTFDSQPNIQACEDWIALQNDALSIAGVAAASIYKMTLEKGSYLLGATLTTGSYCHYDFSKALLFSTEETFPLIDTVGYRNHFENIIFDGGSSHIRVIGPNVDTMQITENGCEHRSVGDVSIFHDLSVNHGPASGNPRTGYSMQHIITNFKSYRHSFIRSACDGVVIDGGWAQFRPYLSGDNPGVEKYWGEALVGPLTAKNVLGVSAPDGGVDDLSFWFKSGDLAYVTTYGSTNDSELKIDNFRCGEGGSAIVKADYCKQVVITNSPIFGRAGNAYAWMEIYNKIPSIKVTDCEGWTDSLGVLIDSATIPSISSALLVNESDLSININDNKDNGRAGLFAHNTRAGYKVAGLTEPNIASNFVTFNDDSAESKEGRSKNLFQPAGTFSFTSGAFTNGSIINNAALGTDTATGYALEVRQASADGAEYGKYLNWIASANAVYNYSVVLKNDKPITLVLSYGVKVLKRIYIPATTEYVRYSAAFMHFGGTNRLTMQIENIPSSTIFSVGLPQLSIGRFPNEYKMAQNDFSAFIPEISYGTSIPATGFNKRGDRRENTSPSAGGFSGWICISGDSTGVGTWKGYGLIEA